jgi:hypothetical protein
LVDLHDQSLDAVRVQNRLDVLNPGFRLRGVLLQIQSPGFQLARSLLFFGISRPAVSDCSPTPGEVVIVTLHLLNSLRM